MLRRNNLLKCISLKGNAQAERQDNRGISMVTVLISFALLLLLMTSYFRIYRLAGEMMMSSRDMLMNNSQLIKAYYLGETDDHVVSDHVRIGFAGESGSFYVEATLKSAQKQGLSGTVYYFSEA